MPTVPVSPSTCTYSWLLAYLLSSGVIGSLLRAVYAEPHRGISGVSARVLRCHRRCLDFARHKLSSIAPSLPGALVERGRNDACARLLAADQDRKLRPRSRFSGRKIREADRFFQCRRMGAAGDHADFLGALHDRVSVAGDAAVDHLESDELP